MDTLRAVFVVERGKLAKRVVVEIERQRKAGSP